ncbi:MAG: hypothetical protein H6867_08030 [Rhodospirillales bacterium]|nr:hypothetical protein [Rhodospirillales bacterium]MCB9995501.1 hypothetical protein [Rhodospirillales bacterium]
MAEQDEATEQPEQQTEEGHDEPVLSAAPEKLSRGGIDFPIEGESRWVHVMRALAFGVFASLMTIGAVFHFLGGDDSFVESQQLSMILGGIVFVLLLEYFVFLKIVIPRQADYGRFEIREHKVDFYPLSALGLGIKTHAHPVSMGKFMGITTGRTTDKKGVTSYNVFLVHKDNKGKTIRVSNFADPVEAENYATKLAAVLRLNMVSGLVKKPPEKRRAL